MFRESLRFSGPGFGSTGIPFLSFPSFFRNHLHRASFSQLSSHTLCKTCTGLIGFADLLYFIWILMVLDKPILSSQAGSGQGFLGLQVVTQAFQTAQVLNLHTFGLVTLTTGTGIGLDKPIIHIVGLLEHLEQELKLLIGGFIAAILRLLRLMGFLGSYQPTRKIHLNLIKRL